MNWGQLVMNYIKNSYKKPLAHTLYLQIELFRPLKKLSIPKTVLFSPVFLNPTRSYPKRFALQGWRTYRHLYKRLRRTRFRTTINVRWNFEHSEICFFYITKSIGRITTLCKHIMITIFYFANHKLYNRVENFGIYTAIGYSSELP
jgi:hypothetical protein